MGYFNHPFDYNNRMRLIDDIGLDHSVSEDSLQSDFEGVDLSALKGKRNAKDRDTTSSLFDLSQMLNTTK